MSVAGTDRRQIMIATRPPPLNFELAAQKNILIQPAARENFRRWLESNSLKDTGEALKVSRQVVIEARRAVVASYIPKAARHTAAEPIFSRK